MKQMIAEPIKRTFRSFYRLKNVWGLEAALPYCTEQSHIIFDAPESLPQTPHWFPSP